MFSINKWKVEGKVVGILEQKKGYWITIKGIAKNHSVFNSDTFNIRCWILKKNLKGQSIKSKMSFLGHFVIKKDDCYFIAEDAI